MHVHLPTPAFKLHDVECSVNSVNRLTALEHVKSAYHCMHVGLQVVHIVYPSGQLHLQRHACRKLALHQRQSWL